MRKIFIAVLGAFLIYGCGSTTELNNDQFENLLFKKKKNFFLDTNLVDKVAREFVITGSKMQQQGLFAEAAIEFIEASRYDSSAAILYGLGRSYKEINKFNLAEEAFIASLKKNPNFEPSLEHLAEVYLYKEQVNDAITVYKQLIATNKTDNRMFTLARLYEFGDVDKAIEIYNELLEKKEDLQIYNRLVNLYRQKEDRENYLATLEKILKYSPGSGRVAQSIMEAYVADSSYNKALNLLETLDVSLPLSELAFSYTVLGNGLYTDSTEKAEEYIDDFLSKIDERFHLEWRVQMISGYLSDKIGRADKRDYFFNRTLKTVDSIPEIPLQIASYYMGLEDYSKSGEIFASFKNEYPGDWRFPFYEGISYSMDNEHEFALGAYQQALEIDSTNIDILTQLGLTYDMLDNHEKSDETYEKALEINPDDPMLNNNYAYSLSERGLQLQRAYKMSKYALSSDSTNAAFLDTYGYILHKLGRNSEAVTYIKKAISTGEASAEVFENLGDVYISMDDKDNAMEAWEKSLEIEPGRESVIEKINKYKKS
jgi:tetratricopeptide (TPR) repeat protein